jgi:hypothetical protein
MISLLYRSLPSRALLALLLCLLPASVLAARQDEPMEVRSSADYVYGQSMNFHLAAANAGQIEAVTLLFRLGASPDSFSVDVPITPGERVDVVYTLDLSQTRLPPFGSITYWWELRRDIGSPLRVPEQVVSYVDDQFIWRQLAVADEQGGGSVRIHWTGDQETLGELTRDVILEILPAIGRLMPLEHIIPFDVYIYPSTADLGAALLLAGREYAPGQTYPDLGVALATVVNPETAESELRYELSRELVDLLLYQRLNQYAHNVPPWLRRGLASMVRGQSDPVLDDALRSALAAETTIPFGELCAGMAIEDDLAAAQSEALVAFIAATYGDKAVRDLIMAFAAGDECAAAVRQATQLSPEQLEATWQRAQSSDPGSRTLAEVAVWLVFVLAGFGLAGLLLWRPRRPKA